MAAFRHFVAGTQTIQRPYFGETATRSLKTRLKFKVLDRNTQKRDSYPLLLRASLFFLTISRPPSLYCPSPAPLFPLSLSLSVSLIPLYPHPHPPNPVSVLLVSISLSPKKSDGYLMQQCHLTLAAEGRYIVGRTSHTLKYELKKTYGDDSLIRNTMETGCLVHLGQGSLYILNAYEPGKTSPIKHTSQTAHDQRRLMNVPFFARGYPCWAHQEALASRRTTRYTDDRDGREKTGTKLGLTIPANRHGQTPHQTGQQTTRRTTVASAFGSKVSLPAGVTSIHT